MEYLAVSLSSELVNGHTTLKFLTGKGGLNNLELNAQFLTEILQLPPWIQISRVVCDQIKAHVPFMKLGTEPIKFVSAISN